MGPITVSSERFVREREPGHGAERVYWLLWFAMLSTTTGTMLLLLGLASILYVERGSSLAAGAVFVSQWLLPVFLVGWLGRLGRFQQPVRVLAGLELAQLLLLLPVASKLLPAAFTGLVIRGVMEAMSRSLRSIALKLYIPGARLEKAATLFNASQYLGVALGGVVSYAGIQKLDVHVLVLIAASCHGLSLMLYLVCPRLTASGLSRGPQHEVGVWVNALDQIKRNGILRKSVIQLTLCTALLQGFHTVARAVLPVALLHGKMRDGLLLQAGIGPVILAALALYGYLMKKNAPRLLVAEAALLFAGCCVATLSLSGNLATGFGFYWFFFFCFELVYTKLSNEVLLSVDRAVVGDVSVVSNSIVTACLALSVVITGYAADRFGLARVCAIVGGIAVLLAIGFAMTGRRGGRNSTLPG